MPIIVTPEEAIPIPFIMRNEDPKDIWERTNSAFKTTEFLIDNGLRVDITEADQKGARAEFMGTPTSTDMTPGRAIHLKALLQQYDLDVVRSAIQLRNYIKLRLLEHSDSPRDVTSLRALELLGKLSDVNAFAENINVTVEHRTTIEIENELATKLSTYLTDITEAEIIEEPPIDIGPLPDADELLGLAGEELNDGS